jgi:hypothetical protein
VEARNRVGIGLLYQPARLHRQAGRYDNSVPTRFLVPIDCSKIPAQYMTTPQCIPDFCRYRYTVRMGHVHLCSGMQYTLPTLTVLTFANQTNQTYIDLVQYDALTCICQVPTRFQGHYKAKSPLLVEGHSGRVNSCILFYTFFHYGSHFSVRYLCRAYF